MVIFFITENWAPHPKFFYIQGFWCVKTCKVSKVHARSHEINKSISSSYYKTGREQSIKPMIRKSVDQSMTIDALLVNWHQLASANDDQSIITQKWSQLIDCHWLVQKHCDYWLENQTLMLSSVPQMLKKMKNRRKQNFEGEANNMQLDKEDTRRSN